MSSPLEWIKPVPEDVAALDKAINDLVFQVRRFKGRPNYRAFAVECRQNAKKYRAAAKALAVLPDPYRNFGPVVVIQDDLTQLAESSEGHADFLEDLGLAPKRKGNVEDKDKTMTALGARTILLSHGLNHSDASVARLALWVWNEAYERPQDNRASDLDAWESTVRRSCSRHK